MPNKPGSKTIFGLSDIEELKRIQNRNPNVRPYDYDIRLKKQALLNNGSRENYPKRIQNGDPA